MLSGLMFLPDGRVLIMDSELYKQTIEKSIVLDLFDGTSLSSSATQSYEEEKTNTRGGTAGGKEAKKGIT